MLWLMTAALAYANINYPQTYIVLFQRFKLTGFWTSTSFLSHLGPGSLPLG